MSLTISYTEISVEVADYLGLGRTSGDWSSLETDRINSIIKSGLRQVYYPQRVRPDIVHSWSWMSPKAEIETRPVFNTGTIEVVNGVVELSGTGVWPTWAADGDLTFNGLTYTVASYSDDNEIVLDDLTVNADAGTVFRLSQTVYSLPEGFDGSFDGPLNYQPSGDERLFHVKIVSPATLRDRQQYEPTPDAPRIAAIQPSTFDPTVGQRWEMRLWPTPSKAWTLEGRYRVRGDMIDGVNLYPLGGTAVGEVILASCLAVAEKRFVEDTNEKQKEFLALLDQAIADDAHSHSPDFLGYNADRSEAPDPRNTLGRIYDNAIHSFEGVVYRD